MIAPSLSKGGMERQLSYFLNNYDRNKIKVTLALLRNNVDYEIPSDIDVVFLKYKKRNTGFYFRLLKLLSNKKYDIKYHIVKPDNFINQIKNIWNHLS